MRCYMGPEAAIFGAVMLFLLAVGIIVKEITIDDERKRFDKSKIKYTDGDNT